MPTIGPRFVEELEAAGVVGLPFAWGSDGSLTFGAAITPEQQTAIRAVLAAHNPAAPATDIDAVRDAYVAAKAAVQALAADGSVPAVVRQAVVKLGQCVEELLRALNRRIA